jgi:membrane-bound lytic murein transglycosylase B
LDAKDVNFTQLKVVQDFIQELSLSEGLEKKELVEVFASVQFLPKVLEIYNIPFNRYKTDASWKRYSSKIITSKRVKQTHKFINKHSDVLKKAEDLYQVPKEYIATFIGIESHFGSNTGKFSVLNSLSSLAFFKNRKQKFFKNELRELFILASKKGIKPNSLKGSFAGAMGCVQQLPSVHNRYGVDFDNDGKKDMWNMSDCIGTIANFLHQNGWENGKTVAVKARYGGKRYRGFKTGYNKIYTIAFLKEQNIIPTKKFPEPEASLLQLRAVSHDEIWLGAKNFRILTKYNNSTNYGMAIYQLSQRVISLAIH